MVLACKITYKIRNEEIQTIWSFRIPPVIILTEKRAMSLFEIITSLTSFISLGGLGVLLSLPSIRKKARVEAEAAEAEVNSAGWGLEDRRIRQLHDMIEMNNGTLDNLVKRIDDDQRLKMEKDSRIDELMLRNRELSDRLYVSEQEQNRINALLLRTTEERDVAESDLEYYRQWLCVRSDCATREPRNERLVNMKFVEPHKSRLKNERVGN